MGASDWIHRVRDAALIGNDLLRPQRDARRFFRRQGQRLVAPVAMERLRAAAYGGHRLAGAAHMVVVWRTCGERAGPGLGAKARLTRARVGGAEPVAHDARPQTSRRPELGDLLEEVVVGVEEK